MFYLIVILDEGENMGTPDYIPATVHSINGRTNTGNSFQQSVTFTAKIQVIK